MQQPLRIALVLETSGGGSGRHALDLAEGLALSGHDVTVIWSPVRAQEDFQTRLLAMPTIKNLQLTMHRAVGLADASSLRALKSLLKAHGPFDVIHGHSSKAGALIRLLPRSIPGARIYTPHAFRTMDPDMGGRARRVYGMIERILAPRGDQIITVSSAEYQHAVGLGINARKLTTVVNGATLHGEADRAAARAFMELGPDDVAVGFIGRLDAQKAPLRFVEAVSLAAKQAPHLRGLVIGDGSLRAHAEALNTADAVRFLGWQDGPALFPGLDVFCMTSHYEAMPYTLLEALHAGVPIVTTSVGGVEETVNEGVNGFVLPTDSTAAEIAEPLIKLATDAGQRDAFGAEAQRMAMTRTVQVMVEDTIRVYQTACAQG
ncbi:glycosyltransferase family 1 protein [Roseobacter denitrificans]|nr:glycosyltransferase family 4 protein [Roseobacter denitrificans]AVL52643.1 glycosyltransferase family 1 protein [Roseobacter denitrificans]SFG22567.1 Glycosyltransferase involved in cell wall bisynthesis [Roseobacter denitrificans OCh 114]